MKNHIVIDGRILQTNKRWSDLKLSQREWITNLLKEHTLDEVYAQIQDRGIWIPYAEIKKRNKCRQRRK